MPPPSRAALPRRSDAPIAAPIAAIAAGVVIIAASLVGVRSFGSADAVPGAAMPRVTTAPHAAAADVVQGNRSAGTVPSKCHGGVDRQPAGAGDALISTPAATPVPAPPNVVEWRVDPHQRGAVHELQDVRGPAARLSAAAQQDGAIVTGNGEKWSENGREIPSSRRTPISVAGTLHEDRLELSFTEVGTRRSSAGRFVWQSVGRW